MPLTAQTLLDRPDFKLQRVSGSPKAFRAPLSWALISELPDPRPYLDGGEIVLTTGSRISGATTSWKQYVGRLVDSGAAALGFGVSSYYPEVPEPLAGAAREADMALMAVPPETQFARVSRAVADGIYDERQKELNFAVAAQRDLTRASLSPYAARAIVDRLAKAVRAWVLLLDHQGSLRAGVSAGRMHLDRIRIDLPRLRDANAASSLSITVAGETVGLLPLVVRGSVRGFLAVGRSTPLGSAEQSIVTTAVSLLAADLHNARSVLDVQRRNRLAVFQIAIEGDIAMATATAQTLDVDFPEGDLRVAVLGVPTGHEAELIDHAERDHGLRCLSALVAEREKGRVVVLMPPAEGDIRTLESLVRRIPRARGAVSDPTPAAQLPEAWREVRSVFSSAPGTAGHLAHGSDVATAGLLRHLNTDQARTWARTLLAPLTEKDRNSKIDLRHTLRTFLAHNGQSDASATSLGVHRHTLRYRMGKVAEALERDLDDPSTRAELWIALQLSDQL
ncbi:PucR family transcriptional regulator [Pseudonocardia endophytica]|uniref:Purine catabolism regulator n=1 Tax=Pseudonocardia endophytica TaxID=401976 RepID=A0A4R1HW21_PSEEN|nr:PucR family transcriptional regulator [Pseudonocardia endophytica]TCK25643.1 purine catabolism regulator [Pseudonocardia endophytica]